MTDLPAIKVDAKVDSKDVADVSNRFLDKIEAAIGKVYEPIHTVRMAKAEAKALTIKADAAVEVSAIQRRALERFVQQETRKQENLEETIEQAKQQLGPDAKPEQLDDDWLLEWSERVGKVSDKEMQSLWARIGVRVAGEQKVGFRLAGG